MLQPINAMNLISYQKDTKKQIDLEDMILIVVVKLVQN